MEFLSVDQTRCDHDGVCVQECPLGVLGWNEAGRVPQALPHSPKSCIRCGHCVAVCPTGALSLAGVACEECRPLGSETPASAEQVEQMLYQRRSIRRFRSDRVPTATLQRLLESTRWAASAKNLHPVRWVLVETAEGVRKVRDHVLDWMRGVLESSPDAPDSPVFQGILGAARAGRDCLLWDAPHVIVGHAQRKVRTAPADASIALAQLDLFAQSLGLGCCWMGYLQVAANLYSPLRQALDVPEDNAALGALLVGYPAVTYRRVPPRKELRLARI